MTPWARPEVRSQLCCGSFLAWNWSLTTDNQVTLPVATVPPLGTAGHLLPGSQVCSESPLRRLQGQLSLQPVSGFPWLQPQVPWVGTLPPPWHGLH